MAVPGHACRACTSLQFLSGAGTRLAECATADSHPFWAVVPNFIPRDSGFQILESQRLFPPLKYLFSYVQG